jgi:hypothetical protein
MIDATDIFMAYRECVRHLWNVYYRIPDEGESDFPFIERQLLHDLFFSRVRNTEFKAGLDGYYAEVVVTFEVPPNGRSILVLNRDISPGVNTWESETIKTQSLDLRYIGMFDFWDPPDGVRDFRFVRARVIGARELPEIAGTDVLIDSLDARISVRP